MARSKRERYKAERRRIELEPGEEDGKLDVEPIEVSESDKGLILEFLDAKDPDSTVVTDPDGTTKSDSTLARYANVLARVSTVGGFQLADATASEVNGLMDRYRSGAVEGVKDGGLTQGTVKGYQSVLRKFYEYHSDLGIGKEEIALFNPDSGSVDERDLFDREEIQAIRDAAQHPRDKALVDMLIYTGQRLSALLNLRLKDIDPEEGVFYLNEDAGDLKGASGKRPLLLAEKAAREWKNKHPCKGDPEAHFISHKYNWENKPYEPGDRLDNSSIYRQLQRIGDRAGVDKPMNAHNFRHTFVTVAKRDYGMDNDTIKRLIGHSADSNIMESTYSHLTDDDIIAEAERATGLREDERESPLTPDVCDNCGEPVPMDTAKACPSCGIAFTPDAKQTERKIQQDIGAEKVLSPDELSQEDIEALAEDDAMLAKLIEARSASQDTEE